jgi:hypothetical protein
MVSLGVSKDMILADCPPEKAFWFNNGATCRNIYQLADTLAKADKYTFTYHVNDDHGKNDFADWIHLVLGDDVLAEQLYSIKDKKKYIEIIRKRIKELKVKD